MRNGQIPDVTQNPETKGPSNLSFDQLRNQILSKSPVTRRAYQEELAKEERSHPSHPPSADGPT